MTLAVPALDKRGTARIVLVAREEDRVVLHSDPRGLYMTPEAAVQLGEFLLQDQPQPEPEHKEPDADPGAPAAASLENPKSSADSADSSTAGQSGSVQEPVKDSTTKDVEREQEQPKATPKAIIKPAVKTGPKATTTKHGK